uniref:alpha-1,2-Mannosidase n=1 Tax=Ascaris lumbricoides TaxID=6252 RepID=A0A9J2PPD1_ASCLU
MNTIRINRRAVVLALLCLVGIAFFVLSMMPSSSEENMHSLGQKILLARDINARTNFPQQEHNLEKGYSAENTSVEMVLLHDDDGGKVTSNDSAISDGESRRFIRRMMLHAWNGYKKYAWGENEVQPIAKKAYSQGIFGGAGSGLAATMVDGLDTLFIMGLTDEYIEARNYLKKNFDITHVSGSLSVFETNIRFLGGMLSAYALTGEHFYIDKAKSIGDVLLKAFNTQTGIPKSSLNPSSGQISNYGWANGGSSILAEFGSLHLEFTYLSVITGNTVQAIRDHLDRIEKIGGLYPNYLSADSGTWTGTHVSLGAMGDSFYEYLIKSYIQSNKNDTQAWRMYTETIDAIEKQMVRKSKGGLTYVAEWRNGILEHKMGHLACFCVGMFALQSRLESDPEKAKRIMNLAEEIGNTCHESYVRSETGLGPEMFYFTSDDEAKAIVGEHGYILRPEVIEGWFYLWRLTGKPIYKEWVWAAIQAIEKYCKKEGGYAGLVNVYDASGGSDDVQQSFFLAETLKYAYLTFTDASIVSLDDWVFNTEAHPLPILRKLHPIRHLVKQT